MTWNSKLMFSKSNTYSDEQDKPFFIKAWLVLCFLLVCRIISMCLIPLNDSTEARYGEIARKMLETGNWVTPMHDYGIPFWAKPPLSTWLSALSMGLFGVNEFAVRLPGLLLSIGMLWLVFNFSKKHSGSTIAMLSTVVLASCLYFFLDAGTVMTDPALLFCSTLSMIAFWNAMEDGHRGWAYTFFVGLGLGLLAKGPVVLVLIGLPVFCWVVYEKAWYRLWVGLPWIKGSFLMLAIALPWYILAEIRTPGFLNYFIVGEHLHRFLTPGWTGDKYGMAHNQPWGMIWLYAAVGIFPWSIVGALWLLRYAKKFPGMHQEKQAWIRYLLFVAMVPLCFFTFARNIIYTYVFPILPAFALLFTENWAATADGQAIRRNTLLLALVPGILFLIGTFIFIFQPNAIAKTQKPLIQAWIKKQPARGSELVYWHYSKDYSAQFYSGGRVKATSDEATLCAILSNHRDNYLIMDAGLVNAMPEKLSSYCKAVEKLPFRTNTWVLFHCDVLHC
jgi:4-amino-4-deoxy-L-arabinose transferase-like glycosyltransferase